MTGIKAILKLPHDIYTGNLLWNVLDVTSKSKAITQSIEQLRKIGYWASPFPEGDGVTFYDEAKSKRNEEIVVDIRECFDWLDVSLDLTDLNKKAPRRSPIPSLKYEPSIVIQKSSVALTQLEDAIELFLTGRRLSAITLAAAADGIFSGLLLQKGIKPAAQETWDGIEAVRRETGLRVAGDRTEKDAFNEWNWHRNRLKHHDEKDEEDLEINVFDQAYYAIQRAIADAEKLGLDPCNRIRYESWVIENVYS